MASLRTFAGKPLSELARATGAALDGDGSVVVTRVATLEHAQRGDIAFLANPKYRGQLAATQASAVIVDPAAATATPLPKLVSPNPYAIYARVAAILHPVPPPVPGVDARACVDASATVAASASVGPFAVIERNATIGERAVIGAHCVVGAGASIAADVVLDARVTVYPACVIGARTLVHSGAVIGADGYGLAEEGGRWLKIAQIGHVVIGSDVEIGANTAVAGCVGIAGSTRIGAHCRIGGAAMISGHLEIAAGSAISAATLVYDSIRDPGIYTGAFPALPHREWKRVASQIRRLRELADRVSRLEAAPMARQNDKKP
jgi:UDP-3-O-[3-hydroxymyristoyl] glucosamine N-acyltransferase